MKIVLDMNLSPAWCLFLRSNGYETIHWSKIGDITAIDSEIMEWARENKHIVFTHDLDFGALLFATKAKAPSVIQLRALAYFEKQDYSSTLLEIKKVDPNYTINLENISKIEGSRARSNMFQKISGLL